MKKVIVSIFAVVALLIVAIIYINSDNLNSSVQKNADNEDNQANENNQANKNEPSLETDFDEAENNSTNSSETTGVTEAEKESHENKSEDGTSEAVKNLDSYEAKQEFIQENKVNTKVVASYIFGDLVTQEIAYFKINPINQVLMPNIYLDKLDYQDGSLYVIKDKNGREYLLKINQFKENLLSGTFESVDITEEELLKMKVLVYK